MKLMIFLLIILNFSMCQKDEFMMAEIIKNTNKAQDSIKLHYFTKKELKKSVRYYIDCKRSNCSKIEENNIRVEAAKYQEKYNIPVYEVKTPNYANLIITIY